MNRQPLYEPKSPHRIHGKGFLNSSNGRITMVRATWMLTLALAVVTLAPLGTNQAKADVIVSPSVVSYYYTPPTVAYYSPPVVYTPAPAVPYLYGASVSYYTPPVVAYRPAVSYYAAPAAVTATRYGLLGRPRVISTYYPPAFVVR
jgi:hypothetical protein